MKFLSPKVVICFFRSTMMFSCLQWCFHVLTSKILDTLQKRVYRTVGLSFTAFFELLPWRRKEASSSLFCRCYSGKSLSELHELVSLLFLVGGPLVIRARCVIYFVSIHRCCKDTYVHSFFPLRDWLSNSLHIEYFPLTNDLTDFKSRVNRYLLSLWFFNIAFL